MPKDNGNWHEFMYDMHAGAKRVWKRVFEELADDPDLEYLMVDGSIVRVHQHGAAKKRNVKSRPKAARVAG
jgi:transposase